MTAFERRRAGLTLIELTLVTLILLTLVGLSVPLFKRTFSDLSVRNASFNITKLINYAQEMSVLERKNYKIVFDFQKGAYQLLGITPSAKGPVSGKITGKFGKSFGLPHGAYFAGEKREIVFYPDGHCDELKINILVRGAGYSVTAKRFGNMVEVKEAKVEQ